MSIILPEILPEGETARPRQVGPRAIARQDIVSPKGIYRRFFKRVFDVAAVLAAAPVILPVIAGLALVVRRDGGPAFYSQLRVGKGGRSFRMWKLRSMVPDADARMDEYLQSNAAARVEWEMTQKLRHDPRITRVGHFIRRSSLDELPQLWNVLKGEMSLVGPRPMMPCQQSMYPGRAYYLMRPGITGLWQTAGRHATAFSARAVYDGEYEATLSLGTDLRILSRTVGVVMKCTGC